MLITDQVATAPCTDPIQVRVPQLCLKSQGSFLDRVSTGSGSDLVERGRQNC
jgi:hypothetical protein